MCSFCMWCPLQSCGDGSARGTAQAPPCPLCPLPNVKGSSGKEMFQIGGREGRSGAGAARFCSAEKGGLFFADQPAILTGGV